MRKMWIIVQREYITRVRKRTFILVTLLSPLFFIAIGLLSVLIPLLNQRTEHILVKDESGLINVLPDSSSIYFNFRYGAQPLEELKKNFSTMDDGYDALLYIPAVNPGQPNGIQLFSNEQVSFSTRSYIENILADKFEEINLQKLNYSKERITKTRPRIAIDDQIVSGDKQRTGDAAVASALGYGMGFMIYIVLLIYGTLVMRGVMEEKTNRIVEVMISSVKPFQLMMGKIIGLGMVGLTQFSIWGFLIFIGTFIMSIFLGPKIAAMQSADTMQNAGDTSAILHALNGLHGNDILFYILTFLVFFMGGYLLYSALFAAVGSLASDDDGDIQMYTFPLTMLILVSIFIMMAVVQQPHTKLAFWASIIPFSSPIVMPALIPFQPPAWQIALSIVMLIGGFIGTTYLAAKVYRVGILMYGKKPKLREVFKWIRYKG